MTNRCDPRTNEQIPNYPNWCDQKTLALLPTTSTSHIPNSSAKLMDTL